MRALLSVSDKTGIETFARGLRAIGIEVVSTGNTSRALESAGIETTSISDVTGFPEILGGRVKTLHPAIHGGILARRGDESHMAELAEHNITPIDIVVCNLYPFEQTAGRQGVTEAEAIEDIDIGGVTLLRAAAKNYQDVTVIVRPEDYPDVLTELETAGHTSMETRRRLAAFAFQHTSLYDTAISAYLRQGTPEALLPPEMTIGLHRMQILRYGENPHQKAALYAWDASLPDQKEHGQLPQRMRYPTVTGSEILQGKELSFNNLLDLDAALNAVASFTVPAAVVIKHTNPCGLACGEPLVDAYRRAHAGDPVSAYGGILGFNRVVDEPTAAELAGIFYEAIIAPGYTPEALTILQQKKSLRLLATNTPIGPASVTSPQHAPRLDIRRVSGGLLVQTMDVVTDRDLERKVVTEREPTLEEVTDLLFAWKAVQHVKSNAIVLAKKLSIVGVGAGQMNRVYSVHIAADRAGDRARGSVLASDAFFPFADNVERAAKAGVTAIIQPGGSIRDQDVIHAANKSGIAMVFTGQRHFRH
jgi:phosphoribosylaminoimidazolecarboxamide formyltransferase/IMP cyclohydrolase